MILWGIFFTLFGGLRWEIGNDWYQYYDHFLFSDWSNIFNYDRYSGAANDDRLEPGFVFINVLIKSLFGEFYIYNLIIVGFVQLTYYKFCNYFFSKNPLLAYCFLMVIIPNYAPVRAGLATSICFWGWRFIKERRLFPFLIIVSIAFMIHHMSIILLPCYWLGYLNMKARWYLIVYPIIAVFSYALSNYFSSLMSILDFAATKKAYFYTLYETEGGNIGVRYATLVLNYFFLCVYLYTRKTQKLTKDFWYSSLLNVLLLYDAIFMLFRDSMADLTRLSTIYFPAQCILFISTFLSLIKSPKALISSLAIIFFLAYYIYKIPSSSSGYFFKDAFVPYKTIYHFNVN